MPVEEIMILDQFLAGAPEDLRIWLKERKPQFLQQAEELADDYTLARGGVRSNRRPQTESLSPVTTGGNRPSGDARLNAERPPFQPRGPVRTGERRRTSADQRQRREEVLPVRSAWPFNVQLSQQEATHGRWGR